MAHTPKPFYRSARNAFYIQLGKQQVKLVSGPDDAPTEKLAWDAFHRLMVERAANDSSPPPPEPLTVAAVMEKYLDWCQKNRSPRTYEWTQKHLQAFCDFIRTAGKMDGLALKPFHVLEWIGTKTTWGANQRRGAIVAVQRPFSWASKVGYIDKNPLAGIEKPKAERREEFVTPPQFAALIKNWPQGDPFRDLLTFLWETGCRPQEARHVEPRHHNTELNRFDIPPQESKGKKRWRVIRLNDAAKEIVERRLKLCEAKVFENEDGKPWTAGAINCRFQRLKRSTGVACFAYALRHGFATRKLVEGHDHLTVAEIMGHANGQMIASVYSHIDKQEEHLRKSL